MPAYDTDEIRISLPDILQTIWELRVPAILLAAIGGILGFMFSAARPVSYTTTASMIVTAKTPSGLYQDENSTPGTADFAIARNLSAYVQFLATTDLVLKRGELPAKKPKAWLLPCRQASRLRRLTGPRPW